MLTFGDTIWNGGKQHVKRALLRAFSVVHELDRRNGKTVLLTFDDGPHPEVTERVLERLKKYDARAVFFVVSGLIGEAQGLLTKILADGHEIGNHTHSHPLTDPWLVPYMRDVQQCQEILEVATGQRPRLFRPPMGRFSVGSLLAPKLLGLRSMYWSVDSNDWRLKSRDEALRSAERLGESLRPGDIVLFHDRFPFLLTVLDELLPILISHGFDLALGQQSL